MSLSAKIKQNWPLAKMPENYVLGESRLIYWDSAALGPEPSMAQIEAVVLPEVPETRMVSPVGFLDRLADAEIVLFATSTNALVIRHWINLTTHETDFDSLDTIEMFAFFVSLNLLSEARAAEVLG